MAHDLAIWIAIWLPIIIGVATALILAFSRQGAQAPEPWRGAVKRTRQPGR